MLAWFIVQMVDSSVEKDPHYPFHCSLKWIEKLQTTTEQKHWRVQSRHCWARVLIALGLTGPYWVILHPLLTLKDLQRLGDEASTLSSALLLGDFKVKKETWGDVRKRQPHALDSFSCLCDDRSTFSEMWFCCCLFLGHISKWGSLGIFSLE